MAATLTEERFARPGWVFEQKLDGIRLLAFKQGAGVRLLSRKVCRILAASWVESMTSQPNAKRPDYVACMLATKAGGSEREVIAARFFEVRDDKTLAVFD